MRNYISPKSSKSFILSFLFIAPVILLALMIFIPESPQKETSIWVKSIPGVVALLLYWGLGITIIRTRPPKGFNIYEEEYLSESNKAPNKVP